MNLWQKNSVFPPETIQPLFDLANPDHPLHHVQSTEAGGLNNSMDHDSQLMSQGDDSMHATHSLQTGQDGNKQLDQSTIRQLQQFQQMLIRQTSGESAAMGKEVKFNKNLLDFDYGEDEDDHGGHSASPRTASILSDVNLTIFLRL